jgi:hypothetical protein
MQDHILCCGLWNITNSGHTYVLGHICTYVHDHMDTRPHAHEHMTSTWSYTEVTVCILFKDGSALGP